MSQPTTCFGLFYLGHLQVGYLSQKKIYSRAIQPLKPGGLYSTIVYFPLTKVSNLKMA